jgi:hypothetical protein
VSIADRQRAAAVVDIQRSQLQLKQLEKPSQLLLVMVEPMVERLHMAAVAQVHLILIAALVVAACRESSLALVVTIHL